MQLGQRRWQYMVVVLFAVGIALSLAVVQTLISLALPSPESDHYRFKNHCNCQTEQPKAAAVLPETAVTNNNNCNGTTADQSSTPQRPDRNVGGSLIGARLKALAGTGASNQDTIPANPLQSETNDDSEPDNPRQQQPNKNGASASSKDGHDAPEFPYPLSCPGQTLQSNNQQQRQQTPKHQLVLAYHVGMMRNWRSVVRDQLHTLSRCGLAAMAHRVLVSYSYTEFERKRIVQEEGEQRSDFGKDDLEEDPAMADVQNVWKHFEPKKEESNKNRNALRRSNTTPNSTQPQDIMLRALQQVWSEYDATFRVREPTWIFSPGTPWEGTILNHLRQHCTQQEQQENSVDDYQPTVVFYFHTKGTSRYKPTWRGQLDQPYTYSRVLYWRKYMEAFLLERPAHCRDKILRDGALTCGVDHRTTGVYAGNFWAASCEYLAALPELEIFVSRNNNKIQDKEHYFDMEHTFGKAQRQWKAPQRFVSLHQPNASLKGLYYRLMEPTEYSERLSDLEAKAKG